MYARGTGQYRGRLNRGRRPTDSSSASSETMWPEASLHPLVTGFITPTFTPRSFSIVAMAAATMVLPTPVSVPVMKIPGVAIVIFESDQLETVSSRSFSICQSCSTGRPVVVR